jgi:hypothetical protein
LRAAPAFIRERQEDFPPWTGRDRVPDLFAGMAPTLPASLTEMLRSGSLALGEVGEPGIRAKRENLGNNEFSVEVYSGLMEFFATVCGLLCSAGTHTTPTHVEQPGVSREEVIQAIARLFTDWRDGHYAQRFQRPVITAGAAAAATAQRLETHAVLFVIAHELGHVFIESDEAFDAVAPDEWGGAESTADYAAIKLLLRYAPAADRYRSSFAGALIAVRIFNCLEKMGAKFDGTHHPPPGVRLQLIKSYLLKVLGSDYAYTRYSVGGLAMDEYLESVENQLSNQSTATEQTAERVSARLWMILEAGGMKALAPEHVRRDLLMTVERVPEPVMREVAANFRRWFLTGANDLPPAERDSLEPVMAEILKTHLPHFPEPARSFFLPA